MGSWVVAVLVLSGLVLVHELGHFLAARRAGVGVETFSVGFGPRVWSVRRGGTDYVLSAFPLGGYVKMTGEHPGDGDAGPPPDPGRSFENKTVWARIGIVGAGPAANVLFAVVIFWVVFMAGVPTLLAEIGSVSPNFPAADAGLRPGDRIEAIDGRAVATWDELSGIVHASAGVELRFGIRRGEELLEASITPRASETETIFGEKTTVGLIGIAPAERFMTQRFGPAQAALMSLRRTGEIVRLTLVGIVKIFQRVVPAKTIGGPIMIMQMAGRQAELGVLNLVSFTAFLSISLGLFNLFPIPVLDGGQIWFLLVEAARGRPLPRRVREVTQQVGLALLVMLMFFAFYNDITRIVAGP